MNTAKFVKEITVTDPDSKGEVAMSVFKHDNGGMFALDSSFIEQVFPEDEQPLLIPDPFGDIMDASVDNELSLTGV